MKNWSSRSLKNVARAFSATGNPHGIITRPYERILFFPGFDDETGVAGSCYFNGIEAGYYHPDVVCVGLERRNPDYDQIRAFASEHGLPWHVYRSDFKNFDPSVITDTLMGKKAQRLDLDLMGNWSPVYSQSLIRYLPWLVSDGNIGITIQRQMREKKIQTETYRAFLKMLNNPTDEFTDLMNHVKQYCEAKLFSTGPYRIPSTGEKLTRTSRVSGHDELYQIALIFLALDRAYYHFSGRGIYTYADTPNNLMMVLHLNRIRMNYRQEGQYRVPTCRWPTLNRLEWSQST